MKHRRLSARYHRMEANDRQCRAITDKGERCKRTITGVSYCERHRDREGYNGGGAPPAQDLAALAAMPLRTTGDALAQIQALHAALLAGLIPPATHTTLLRGVQLAVNKGLVRTEDQHAGTRVDDLDELDDHDALERFNKVNG